MPSPSGSDVKLTQNAKPDAVLELEELATEELDEDTLDEDELDEDELDEVVGAELTTVMGGVVVLPPPPPPHAVKQPTKAKHNTDLFKYIRFL
jgi:hypothetical protein